MKREIISIIVFCFAINLFFIWGAYIDIKREINNNKCSCEKVIDTLIIINREPIIKEVTLTVYHPIKEECDDTPLITANGTEIDLEKLERGELKYCAVSQDLLNEIPYDSFIYIEGYGEYEVVDTMSKKLKNTVDILQDINEPIFKKTGIKIIKL